MKSLDVIQAHPTWEIIDSSKLTAFMRCPRLYFYNYILGWKRDYPNNHLSFGTSWHLAVEHLLLNDYSQESLEEAQFLFLKRYREDFDSSTDEEFGAKAPENALRSLQGYAKKFYSDVRNYSVLHTEIAGVVLISPESEMHFKIDALVGDNQRNKYLFIDHKTSQRKYSNWGDHWQLSTQMLLYQHVIHCLFPEEQVGKSKVRCSFFYKKSPSEFEEVSIDKTHSQMESWMERTNSWYNSLKYEMKVLEEIDNTEANVMKSFPMRETACFDFGQQCSYFDFCTTWSNPLQKAELIPLGFKQEYWNPSEQEGIKERMDLTKGEEIK